MQRIAEAAWVTENAQFKLELDQDLRERVLSLAEGMWLQGCELTAEEMLELFAEHGERAELAWELECMAGSIEQVEISPPEIAEAVELLAQLVRERAPERVASLDRALAAIFAYREELSPSHIAV